MDFYFPFWICFSFYLITYIVNNHINNKSLDVGLKTRKSYIQLAAFDIDAYIYQINRCTNRWLHISRRSEIVCTSIMNVKYCVRLKTNLINSLNENASERQQLAGCMRRKKSNISEHTSRTHMYERPCVLQTTRYDYVVIHIWNISTAKRTVGGSSFIAGDRGNSISINRNTAQRAVRAAYLKPQLKPYLIIFNICSQTKNKKTTFNVIEKWFASVLCVAFNWYWIVIRCPCIFNVQNQK